MIVVIWENISGAIYNTHYCKNIEPVGLSVGWSPAPWLVEFSDVSHSGLGSSTMSVKFA